ncbi:MAG: hypothetical protein H7A38_06285 [Chlamydiales bacterium]|nr:hypothetical protein [Chlamydiales bacterium]
MTASGKTGKFGMSTLTFATLIKKYSKLQKSVVSQVRNVASRLSAATPGKFLLLQFSMSQVTQVGDSISNLISQVNTMINNSVRNQKTS